MSYTRAPILGAFDQSCRTYEWVMSNIWTSQVTHMNEARHTYEWVTWHTNESTGRRPVGFGEISKTPRSHQRCSLGSGIRMSRVTRGNASCHTYAALQVMRMHTYVWGMSHIWMSHVTMWKRNCHTCKSVMSHVCMSPVTHMHASCHTCAVSKFFFARRVMLQMCIGHVTRTSSSCDTYTWAVSRTRLYTLTFAHIHYVSKFLLPAESFETCECFSSWVMPPVCMSPATRIHESCHTCVRSGSQVLSFPQFVPGRGGEAPLYIWRDLFHIM